MNRRLRLALFLAALTAAGPSVAATPAFETGRVQVSVAWFCVNPASRPQLEVEQARLKTRLYGAQVESCAAPDLVLPDPLRLHSLFQRPPPLRS